MSLKMKNLTYLLIFFSSIAIAGEESDINRLQIHGFASQALIFTTDNNFFGNSDHGSADFTELGLNASFQLSPKIRLAGQLLSRHAGEMYNGSPRIDYALMDINFISSMQGRMGMYLGRIKNPIGLYNETRDVAFTRQGIFAAQSIYFDKVRNLLLSSDGAQLYSNYDLPNGTLILRAGVGYSIPDKNVEQVYLGKNYAGKLKSNKLAYIGQMMYEHDGGRWITSLTGVTLDINYNSQPADLLSGINDGIISVDYTVLSSQFNGEKWQFNGEVSFEKIAYQGISVFHQSLNSNSLGYSLEASYQFTPSLQTFVRSEQFYLDKHDKYGKKFHTTYPFLSTNTRYSKSWVIGGRWDINKNWMARAEYHSIEGVATLSPSENNPETAAKNWDLFAMSLSYRF